MADSARDAQSVDDRLTYLEVNLAILYRLLNQDLPASSASSSAKRMHEDGSLDAMLDYADFIGETQGKLVIRTCERPVARTCECIHSFPRDD